MFWMCIRIASLRRGDSNIHPQHMILWRNIENYPFYHFDSDPRFPPFLLLGGNLGSLLYGDVSVMFVRKIAIFTLNWKSEFNI